MTKPATPITMWAAVRIASSPGRRDWIDFTSIRPTRLAARDAYLAGWTLDAHREVLSWVRFQRVVVSVEGAARC